MLAIETAKQLFAPCSIETFIDQYLEKEVLHLDRNDPSLVDGIFDLDSMAECIRFGQPMATNAVRVVPSDAPEETASYQRVCGKSHGGPLEAEQSIVQAFANKRTIVFGTSEAFWKPVSRIVESLKSTLQTAVRCNVYCTPPVSQGFDTHVDRHDVLVLQTHGTKTWRLHTVDEQLPIESSNVANQMFSRLTSSSPEYGEPTSELTLRPGDLLYLPRGVPHSAASQGEASIHLTIGLYPLRRHVFLNELVDLIATKELELRRRVPIQAFLGKSNLPSAGSLLRELADFADRLEAPIDPNVLVKLSAEQYGHVGGTEGVFYSAAHVDATNLNSIVKRPEGATFSTRRNQSEFVINCGRTMSVPLKVESILPFLEENESFRVGDLPDEMTNNAKLVLVRSMIKHGLLRIVYLGKPTDEPQETLEDQETIAEV